MNEQEFRKYIEEAMKDIHEKSMAFFKENPEFRDGVEYLSAYFYNHSWSIWNSRKAKKGFSLTWTKERDKIYDNL